MFYGWIVLGAAFLIIMIGIGTMFMAALLVIGLASLYLGWRRAERLADTR